MTAARRMAATCARCDADSTIVAAAQLFAECEQLSIDIYAHGVVAYGEDSRAWPSDLVRSLAEAASAKLDARDALLRAVRAVRS